MGDGKYRRRCRKSIDGKGGLEPSWDVLEGGGGDYKERSQFYNDVLFLRDFLRAPGLDHPWVVLSRCRMFKTYKLINLFAFR